MSKKAGGFKVRAVEKIKIDGIDLLSEFWSKRSAPAFDTRDDWKPSDEELPSYVLTGRLDYIPPPPNKVVKIFLSSTFSDMYVERNYLFSNIYKNLQQYCRLQHDVEFQVVDMRWGVRDEAALDHSGPKTCMDELRSCQELSLGPNFVCLLGQRYGNRPLQAKIPQTEYQVIIESLNNLSEEEKTELNLDIPLLDFWYQCDENSEPPAMILTPLNEKDSHRMEVSEFKPIRQKLHDLLRVGSKLAVRDGKMSVEDQKKYFWSVTEEEVYKGVLSQQNPNDHTLCFVREIYDIDYSHSKVERFVELEDGTKKVNEETTQLITQLVSDTEKCLGSDNFYRFPKVKWHPNGGTNEDSLSDYLVELGKMFEERVKMLIKRAAEKSNPLKDNPFSSLLTEVAEHGYQALAKNKTFQGRDDIMDKIKQYILSESHLPFIMYGESGFGKTSLLAVASARVYDWCGNTSDLIVIRRFLGTTPDSTNIGSLMNSVTKQISLACGFKPPHTDDPMRMLIFTMIAVPSHYRLVIFLDSLDQLSSYGKAHTLAWLPLMLPPNVKLVVSTLPKDHNLLDILKMRNYPGKQFVEVNILEAELSIKLMRDWLMSSGRKLTEPQMDLVAERFREDKNTSPLYIKLIYDVMVKLRSYFPQEELGPLLNEINSPVKCIRYIYNELMKKNGALLVHRLFAYLHLSNLGLTENEMVDLISLDDEVLNDVFQYHTPPLRRLPAVLWARIRNSIQEYIVTREANGGKVIAWYHRQFIEVGDTMYKAEFPLNYTPPEDASNTEALCNILRENMVNYFLGTWAGDKPKPYTLPEHMRAKLNRENAEDAAVRNVPAMPNILENGRPNLRKLGQLPALLIKLGRIEEFFNEVFGNIEGLVGLFSMYSWSDIYEIADGINFDNYKAIGKDKDEVTDPNVIKNPFQILIRSFLLTSAIACAYPKMLGPLILGRLLPFAPGSEILNKLINGVYDKGPKLNSFVCPHAQLEGVGTYLIFEMPNDHVGSCVAMIEVTPKNRHFILTLSKKAVLINMEDGNIQMRYMPPDLRKDDSFYLVAAFEPFEDPKDIAATLKIIPKIYIFSLVEFDVGEIIDCRTVPGYEQMRIQGLEMGKIQVNDAVVVMVHGQSHEGLLMFDVKKKDLLYKFNNSKMILFMHLGHNTLHISQPHLETTVVINKSELVKSHTQVSQTFVAAADVISLQFTTVRQEALHLPSDSIITSKTVAKRSANLMAFATEDGNVYIGNRNPKGHQRWAKILLDSPAVDVQFGFSSDPDEVPLSVCTKHYVYVLYSVKEDARNKLGIHSIPEESLGMSIVVAAKMKLVLSKFYMVNETTSIGYHLGQVYIFLFQSENGDDVSLKIVKKFDAHSRPITGIILNEDVAAMFLTSAEDGSVRVFHAGLNLHPALRDANTFDRMGVIIHGISASGLQSASFSKDNNTVAVWTNATGKVTNQLSHDYLQDEDTVAGTVCFDDCIVTLSCKGVLSFWDTSGSEGSLTEQVELEGVRTLLRGCDPHEVLVCCTKNWYKFSCKSGEVISEKLYEDRELLKVQYVKSQLVLLQRLTEEEELVIEILQSDDNSHTVNLSTTKELDCGKLQDFFCFDHILVLLFPRKCVFYNWKKSEVLQEEQVAKSSVITSQSNTFILKSNCNIFSYKIQHGLEKLNTEPLKLSHKTDQVIITPNGLHVVTIEQKKMLNMYRIGDLSTVIGQYSMYGEIERVVFSSDSAYIVCGIADTRLFYLMLCDVEVDGHHQRALALQRSSYTSDEVKTGKIIIDSAGKEDDSSDEEVQSETFSENINELLSNPIEMALKKVEGLLISRCLSKGNSPIRAIRSVKAKKKVVGNI